MPVSEQRPEVEPVEVDARPVIAVGTGLWLLALLVLGTAFRHTLQEHHATWWLWACGIGAVLGCYGYYYAARRARHLTTDVREDAPISEE